ncbi:DUF4112 domain-containing protein [soil metagenome]
MESTDNALVRTRQTQAQSRLTKQEVDQTLERLRHLSYLLDSAFRIPIIGYRVGWDAIIGLVPGLGDVVGMLFSGYIVFEAARLGAPKSVLARMVYNVALEVIIGAIPLIGDLFDAAWKANIRNVRLLERALKG